MASSVTFDAFEGVLQAWAAESGNLAVIFENEPFQTHVEASLPFVYAEIYGDSYDQDSVGAPGENMWTERGTTWLHVMVPAGSGSRAARVWAGRLTNLFREQVIIAIPETGEALHMPEMSIGAGDPGLDLPNYFSIAATIQWYRRDYALPTS